MKAIGEITSISEVEELAKGAKKLHFEIDTKEEYNNILSFNMFKGAEHVKHVENFTTYNNVGDLVEVEFNIKCREYQGKYYTNLEMWKVNQLDKSTHEQILDTLREGQDDDLPF